MRERVTVLGFATFLLLAIVGSRFFELLEVTLDLAMIGLE